MSGRFPAFAALRAVVYATVFILLWSLLAAGVTRLDPVPPIVFPSWMPVAGVAAMIAGGVLVLWCAVLFVSRGRGTPAPFDPPRQFVAAGPYRVVRNPMYIGALAVLAGSGLYVGSVSILILSIIAAALFHALVVLVEEPGLTARFGDSYLSYRASVGRWLPGRGDSSSLPRPRALVTILGGGMLVAILDIANAMTFWYLYRGTRPHVIFQSVAAGLLGRDASFAGGAATVLLGALLHLFIACCVAAVYFAASNAWPILLEKPLLCGAIYGAAVYLVMNQIVLQLSRARPAAFNTAWFLDNFIGHVLLVGPPAALVASWSAARGRRWSTA